MNAAEWPQISPLGDAAARVSFGEQIAPEINARVHALARQIEQAELVGLGEPVAAYASLLVHYDPLALAWEQVEAFLRIAIDEARISPIHAGRRVEIPVVYGGAAGPDLPGLAARHGLRTAEIIRLHSQTIYRVYMIGFTPGFPYLGEVDERIATPRLDSPRTAVPAGSVGIAGRQTGIYPFESPGGWQIIGRTALRLFDASRQPPALLQPGDLVQFIPVGELGEAD